MTLYKWSQTTASNATADSTVNWAEGQAPSSVNDSARAMMTAVSKYRDDISGAIVTAGTSTAYTVTSYEVFDTLAHMSGQMIAFTPHATNAATVTLNVDGLGAKPLRTSPNTELLAGMLVQGTPYVATYNNSDASWYLQNFYGNPYNIPLGSGLDYWGTTAPNSSFVIPIGQAISRTTYASLFTLFSTTYGAGDGSTTFNLPDKRGRVSAAVDSGANRLGNVIAGNLGSAGGADTHVLSVAEVPALTFSGTTATNNVAHTHTFPQPLQKTGTPTSNTGGSVWLGDGGNGTTSSESAPHTHTFGGTTNGGGGAHAILQPTIVSNYILRVI